EPQHAEIGQAPSDGAGLLVAGAVIIPSAALLLYLSFYDPAHQPASTITMGVGFGLIGAGLIGFGGYRRYKLQRWARARRVIVQRQGAGLLVVGGLTAAAGVSAIGGGIVVLALTSGPGAGAGGATLIGAGVLLGAVAAAPLVIGKRRRVEYQQTGGWIRRPLTHIEWAPRLMAGRDRLGLGVMGRF